MYCSGKLAMFGRQMLSRTTRMHLLFFALVVSLVPAAFAQGPVAKVLEMSGQVSLQQGGYLKPVFTGDTIKQMQVIVTGPDGWAKFQYTDGSTFEVFPNAQVIFREQPTDWEHLLNVIIGRVKVMIQHAPGVPNHKNVTTPTALISVRGTVFDINVEDTDGTTFVAVEEGIVDVQNLTAGGPVPRLQAGESIHVYRGQPLALAKDHGFIENRIFRAALDAAYRVVLGRSVGGPGGLPGAGPAGPQADKNKNGDKGGTGTTTAPAPPAPPAPPPPSSGTGH